ncbi:MAG: hypothetical protein ACI9BD_001411 [Candidatus Marinamargulisbacteria bacterium]|jgi:hypothetical protein
MNDKKIRLIAIFCCLWLVGLGVQNEGKLRTLSYSFHNMSPSVVQNEFQSVEPMSIINARISPVVLIQDFLTPEAASTATEIIGDVFNHPNPFRLASGTEIGYELSRDMDVEIQIYDILGHLIHKRQIGAGDVNGGKGGQYNKVSFSDSDVGGAYLPSSIYFYLVIHDGHVLGRGKMAVIP